MDEFGIETREGNPPELGGSELMPSAHARSDEPEAKTGSRGAEKSVRGVNVNVTRGGVIRPGVGSEGEGRE